MAKDDPLEELLLDAEEVDRSRVTAALRDFVGIDKTSSRVVPKPRFSRLSARQKLLVSLLGTKAAALLGRAEAEGIQPKEMAAITGLPKGTVHPTLKELREKRLVSQDEEGAYFVAPAQLADALEELEAESG